MENTKYGLKTRIQEKYSIFDKALNTKTRGEGMGEVFSLFPELIGVSIERKNFEFASIREPGIIINLTKQSGEWEMTVDYIPTEDCL